MRESNVYKVKVRVWCKSVTAGKENVYTDSYYVGCDNVIEAAISAPLAAKQEAEYGENSRVEVLSVKLHIEGLALAD